MTIGRLAWTLAAIGLLLAAPGCRAAEAVLEGSSASVEPLGRNDPLRGIWVTRFDYIEPGDVREIMRNVAQLGVTDVFWQVRGQADAYYESDLEPWGEMLFRDANDDKTPPTRAELAQGPGYDPLALAVREAHRRGMRLHAWINVMPLWRGTAEPAAMTHPWKTRRAWRLRDDRGVEQPLNDHYVIVNPVLPGVQDHIAAVARDIVSRYDVDGLHLDYIRFISESLEEGRWYPGDAVSVGLYRQAHGLGPDAKVDGEMMRPWVRDKITALVERIRREAVDSREGVTLSAAVWRRPDLARDQQLQDAAAWAERGVVDVLMPMIYTDDDKRFRSDLAAWTAAAARRGAIAPGVGLYKHETGRQTVGQVMMHAEDDRFVLFAYNSVFHSRAPGSKATAERERLNRRNPLRTIMAD